MQQTEVKAVINLDNLNSEVIMHNKEDKRHICTSCYWEQVPQARAARCIKDKVAITCAGCGEEAANQVKHCIAPINKSNYYYISNMELLKQLNPKRTT
jgi:RNase P subunit RPR2